MLNPFVLKNMKKMNTEIREPVNVYFLKGWDEDPENPEDPEQPENPEQPEATQQPTFEVSKYDQERHEMEESARKKPSAAFTAARTGSNSSIWATTA